jgi:signal-transduction protein with cAMP-binding, CBS, and nucleotidyltransferase domain
LKNPGLAKPSAKATEFSVVKVFAGTRIINVLSLRRKTERLIMRTVADLLAAKSYPRNIISPEALVVDALFMMRETNLSYVIAMNGPEFEGIFSERNYARSVALEGKSSSTCKVREAMTRGLNIVSRQHTVEACIHLILDNKGRYLPVIEEGKFLGVVTIHDILRELLRSREALFDSQLADRLMDAGGIY